MKSAAKNIVCLLLAVAYLTPVILTGAPIAPLGVEERHKETCVEQTHRDSGQAIRSGRTVLVSKQTTLPAAEAVKWLSKATFSPVDVLPVDSGFPLLSDGDNCPPADRAPPAV
ncbi:MAG: hypothetical protein IT282_02645 [Bacteroidetes bacterium]|nr:hypothetical protein [Bacteroidota bacterium]